MFLGGMISWWYTKGIQLKFKLILSRAASMVDLFSIRLLVATWLSPYKQISASRSMSSNFVDQFKNMIDQLISRSIGAVIRTFMIIIGSAVVVVQFVVGILLLSFWLILPILPIVLLILAVTGKNFGRLI